MSDSYVRYGLVYHRPRGAEQPVNPNLLHHCLSVRCGQQLDKTTILYTATDNWDELQHLRPCGRCFPKGNPMPQVSLTITHALAGPTMPTVELGEAIPFAKVEVPAHITQALLDAFQIMVDARRLNKKLIKALYGPGFDWAEEPIIRAALVDLNRAQVQLDNLAALCPMKAYGQ